MKNLSYQLYSSREYPPLEKTCEMLAVHGYKEVEGYGGVYDDPAATKACLDKHGLVMTSGHFPIEYLEDKFDDCVALAKQMGMQTMYCPYLVEQDRPSDVAGWQAIGARLATIADNCADAGFSFGWHNHDFEVKALEDGSMPLDHLLGASDKIELEADLAWIKVGGADIDAVVAKHAQRITAVHIKDIAPAGECADEDGWADIGHGTLDWDALLTSLASSPVRHFILEHDKPNDEHRFVHRSMESLKTYAALQD